jgi:hypothetical protein
MRYDWQNYVACDSIQYAASCNSTYSCSWEGNPPYCKYDGYSYYYDITDNNCYAGVRSPTMACQMYLAENATAEACAVATTKAACNSDNSCVWRDLASKCYGSGIGILKAYKKLGSKVADQAAAQVQACNKAASKVACLAVPLPALAAGSVAVSTGSSSLARGLGCDFFGDTSYCAVGTEFGNKVYANADTEVDQ